MADEEGHGRLGRLYAALEEGAGKDASSLDNATPATAADGSTTVLDIELLSKRLATAKDPMGILKDLVDDVRTRADVASTTSSSDAPDAASASNGTLPPSELEIHLASRLTEAGLLEEEPALPAVRVVRPRTSNFFYLRIDEAKLPYVSKIRILRIEAALNAALIAVTVLDNANSASEAELVQLEQRVAHSIEEQAERVAMRVEGPVEGEWDVRRAIAFGVESFQLPYRLTARYRVNVKSGVAAFQLDLVPPSEWVTTSYVEGLGVVVSSENMRKRACTDYNLRLALLIARYVFFVAPQIHEIWIAGVVDTPKSHTCYYSVRIERELIEGLSLPVDVVSLLCSCGTVGISPTGTLAPVQQTFSLDDELFCPSWRHEPVELSHRELTPAAAVDLGAKTPRDLSIDEAAARTQAATEISRELGSSTEANVHTLLSLAKSTEFEDVAQAARRCVGKLIEGTLDDDPLAIEDELTDGDELSRKASRAMQLMTSGDLAQAEREALSALSSTNADRLYADTDQVSWRSFGSYTERVLYNRLIAPTGRECKLAPLGYTQAHMVACAAALADGRSDEALAHARRMSEIAPLSSDASLNLVQCLEAADKSDEAEQELCRLLTLAHDPSGLGFGYMSMAQLQWRRGNVLAAQACYQRASRYLPSAAVSGLAVVALMGQTKTLTGTNLDEEHEVGVLRKAGIPIAPTDEVRTTVLEAARASVDSELFGVAHNLTESLCALTRDDVYFGMLRSIEGEPDR